METYRPPEGRRPLYQGADGHRRYDGHHRRHRHRGWGILFLVLLVLVAGAAAYIERHKIHREADKLLHLGGTTTTSAPTTTTTTALSVATRPVTASLASWQLPTPISHALTLPGPTGDLLVVGGKIASGSSGTGVFLVDASTGHLSLYANLVSGVYDGAGVDLGGEVYLFGGAGAGSAVQSFSAPTAPTTSPVGASKAGVLPQARAGAAAVVVGPTAYIVGGYQGAAADGEVLSTSDGSSFALVAKLPVAVRDPAVTASGGEIYLFGGEALTAASAGTAAHWAPVSDIQRVNPATGQASLVGHLPVALTGATAANLNGAVYVAGGHGPAGWNATIWGFEPSGAHVLVAGHLPHAVAGAGYTTEAGVAWLVGGNSATGQPVGWVPSFRLTGASGQPPARKP